MTSSYIQFWLWLGQNYHNRYLWDIKGQVALEGNCRFLPDKSDLKSASDKKFVRKATVALQNKICEQNTTPCCERLVISRDFPRSCLYSLFTSTKPRHEGSKKMLPRRILAVIVFYFFLVLQQQANINLMIWCLLFMQNLRTQNLLLTRRIRHRQNRYRRRAPYYWTLPRPVESWFEIHYTDRTIPGDYFRRLLRMNRESFDLLLNVIRNRLTRQNTLLRNCSCLRFASSCTWKFVRNNRTCAKGR